jgi:methylmalonyl-CoA mutase
MKNKYGANERAQMLKYHIQTSGRSLHAEIDFNDIRTTFFTHTNDNCNFCTTYYMMRQSQRQPRSQFDAMAIQLIIGQRNGLA